MATGNASQLKMDSTKLTAYSSRAHAAFIEMCRPVKLLDNNALQRI
jgi:hypothetical protein